MTTTEKDFARAAKSLPIMYDPLAHKTLADLVWLARIELDLIEEDQDGVDHGDGPKLRKWLAKWHPVSGVRF